MCQFTQDLRKAFQITTIRSPTPLRAGTVSALIPLILHSGNLLSARLLTADANSVARRQQMWSHMATKDSSDSVELSGVKDSFTIYLIYIKPFKLHLFEEKGTIIFF